MTKKRKYNNGGALESLLDSYRSLTGPKIYTPEDLGDIDEIGNVFNSTLSGVGAGSTFGPIGGIVGGIVGLGSGIINSVNQNRALRKQAIETNRQSFNNADYQKATLDNALNNYDKSNYFTSLANYAANGGSINIAPSKRGTFTREASKRGLGVQEFASKVLANKDNYSSAMVKKANFARNASKWKHADGGPLTMINNGGTHEENPYGGIPVSIDNQGIPNLVEEGEVLYNDYVYSDRLKVPKGIEGLPKSIIGKTFADAAKYLTKESKERPNDPISKRGMEDSINKLQTIQEIIRMKERPSNKYAVGGKLSPFYNYPIIADKIQSLKTPIQSTTQPVTFNSILDNLPNTSNTITNLPYENKQQLFSANPNYIPLKKTTNTLNPYNIYSSNKDAIEAMSNIMSKKSGNSNIINKKSNISGTDSDNAGLSGNLNLEDKLPYLRYVPALGAGIQAITDLVGLTNKPDYSDIDKLEDISDITPARVKAKPISNYLTYKPIDPNHYTNKLNAMSSANRRSISDLSNANRATQLAALAASDYNAQNALGDYLIQAELANQQNRKRVESFNRGTNQYNSELDLREQMFNEFARTQANENKFRNMASLVGMREQLDQTLGSIKSANLTNLLDSIGDIGREEYTRNMIMSNPYLLYYLDRIGNVGYKKKKGE